MDFAQHVGRGYGPHWRGVIFRQAFPNLADIIAKTQMWFPQIFPDATYNKGDHAWTFRDGEQLLLRYFNKKDDYWNYHGHELPWIGWEELTNWPTLDGYLMMMSCCRSSHPGMPRKYRATANPYGVGHNVVKARFIEVDGVEIPPGTPIVEGGQTRVRIRGTIWENKILLQNDPKYLRILQNDSDEVRRKAWLEGSWDIMAGGMLDDLWDSERHVLEPFKIPTGWRVDRCFDMGSTAPFAALWCAEADGTSVRYDSGPQAGEELFLPRGSVVVFREWYGWNGKPNEGCRMLVRDIARGVKKADADLGKDGIRVHPGPADSQISQNMDGTTYQKIFEDEGVRWVLSDKGPGSRAPGWERMRQYLKAAKDRTDDPWLVMFNTCPQLIRTLKALPRDDMKMDDVAKGAEDHLADALRYRLTTKRHSAGNAPVPWR